MQITKIHSKRLETGSLKVPEATYKDGLSDRDDYMLSTCEPVSEEESLGREDYYVASFGVIQDQMSRYQCKVRPDTQVNKDCIDATSQLINLSINSRNFNALTFYPAMKGAKSCSGRRLKGPLEAQLLCCVLKLLCQKKMSMTMTAISIIITHLPLIELEVKLAFAKVFCLSQLLLKEWHLHLPRVLLLQVFPFSLHAAPPRPLPPPTPSHYFPCH